MSYLDRKALTESVEPQPGCERESSLCQNNVTELSLHLSLLLQPIIKEQRALERLLKIHIISKVMHLKAILISQPTPR